MKIFTKIAVLLYLISSFSSFSAELDTDNAKYSSNENYIESDMGTYSINLLCINKKLDLDQKYICSEKYHAKLISSAIGWREKNSEAIINIWYDGRTTYEDAIKASIELTEANYNIQFKDIHDIGIVQLNEDIFSNKMPLYFRIDLLKLVICNYQIDDQEIGSAVFADIEVKPMNKIKLFSPHYLKKLLNSGVLINGTENQFLQVIKQDEIVSSLKQSVSINLMRAAFALNLNIDNPVFDRSSYLQRIYTSPFYTTVKDFHLYLQAYRFGKIKFDSSILGLGSDIQWVDYDHEVHGYLPFGDIIEPHQGTAAISVGRFKNKEIIPVSKVIRFLDSSKQRISEDDLNDYSRYDVEVRPGGSHIDCVPAKKEVPKNKTHFTYTPF
ncbi:MAG: hypothetical protein AB8G05_21715 [Oligoflexales bacterium]